MECPKCGTIMKIEGTAMVCPNLTCTYQYEIPLKVPPQAELLKINAELIEENKAQKKYITTLESILIDLRYKGMHGKPSDKPQN